MRPKSIIKSVEIKEAYVPRLKVMRLMAIIDFIRLYFSDKIKAKTQNNIFQNKVVCLVYHNHGRVYGVIITKRPNII